MEFQVEVKLAITWVTKVDETTGACAVGIISLPYNSARQDYLTFSSHIQPQSRAPASRFSSSHNHFTHSSRSRSPNPSQSPNSPHSHHLLNPHIPRAIMSKNPSSAASTTNPISTTSTSTPSTLQQQAANKTIQLEEDDEFEDFPVEGTFPPATSSVLHQSAHTELRTPHVLWNVTKG